MAPHSAKSCKRFEGSQTVPWLPWLQWLQLRNLVKSSEWDLSAIRLNLILSQLRRQTSEVTGRTFPLSLHEVGISNHIHIHLKRQKEEKKNRSNTTRQNDTKRMNKYRHESRMVENLKSGSHTLDHDGQLIIPLFLSLSFAVLSLILRSIVDL